MKLSDEIIKIFTDSFREGKNGVRSEPSNFRFPSFDLLKRYIPDEWFAGRLLKDSNEGSCRGVNSLDVTSDLIWDAVKKTFILKLTDEVRAKAAFHIDFFALLPEDVIEGLVRIREVKHHILPITFSILRNQMYCIWDEVFTDVLLHQSPLYPPPFWEARKMLRLNAHIDEPLDSSPQELDIADLSKLATEWEALVVEAFHPGYLVPLVDVKENQKPKFRLLDPQSNEHTFDSIDPDNKPSFLMAYPEEKNRDPVQIDIADLDDRNRYKSCEKFESYTVVTPRRGQSLTKSLDARRKEGNSILQDSSVECRNTEDSMSKIAESHGIILKSLDEWRDGIRTHSLPSVWLLNPFLSSLPTSGDIQHLLTNHPLSQVLAFKLIGEVEPISDDDTSRRIHAYWNENERILDYGWALHRSAEKKKFSSRCARRFYIVLNFEYQKKPDGFDIFAENIGDYLCSYLNQTLCAPYYFLTRARKELAVL